MRRCRVGLFALLCWTQGAWAGPLPAEGQSAPPWDPAWLQVDVRSDDASAGIAPQDAWIKPDERQGGGAVSDGMQARGGPGDAVLIVAAASADLATGPGRWLSREWTSLPADHRALPDPEPPEAKGLLESHPGVVVLGGVAVALVGLFAAWPRRRRRPSPSEPRPAPSARRYQRHRLPRV